MFTNWKFWLKLTKIDKILNVSIFEKKWWKNEKTLISRRYIVFSQNWCFWTKTPGQIEFWMIDFSKTLYLDPSIFPKIPICDVFLTLLPWENTFFKIWRKIQKSIIYPLDYKKNRDFIKNLIIFFNFFDFFLIFSQKIVFSPVLLILLIQQILIKTENTPESCTIVWKILNVC